MEIYSTWCLQITPVSSMTESLSLMLQSTSHHSIVMVSTSYKIKLQTEDEENHPPLTMFNALNFFNGDINWTSLSNNIQDINWKAEFNDDDPNMILNKLYSSCLNECTEYVPVKTKSDAKKISKVLRYRRSLTRLRRKLTKRLVQVKSPIAKSKIDSELLQIKKDLQKSLKNSHSHMEQKGCGSNQN